LRSARGRDTPLTGQPLKLLLGEEGVEELLDDFLVVLESRNSGDRAGAKLTNVAAPALRTKLEEEERGPPRR
jgi:hypothetical protein